MKRLNSFKLSQAAHDRCVKRARKAHDDIKESYHVSVWLNQKKLGRKLNKNEKREIFAKVHNEY